MFDFSKLTKQELLRHTGQISQLAGIRRFVYADGMARGLPAIQVRNGSGLSFTVLEGRNMDLYEFEYKGINLAFFYKNGLLASERITHAPQEFLGQGSGGMLYTSGLQNCGPENIAEGLFQPLHGRIHSMGADNLSAKDGFDDDGRYQMTVQGRTREARLFMHNLTLTRTISTALNDNSLVLEDVIENETCRDTDYSIMYHINFGYPMLDTGARLIVPERSTVSCRTDASQTYIDQRFDMTAPVDNFAEHLYYMDTPADADGNCRAMIVNDKLGLAVELTYAKQTLPYLVEWKSMNSGDYALGVMPSSSLLRGRQEELAAGGLSRIAAYSKIKTGLMITIHDDPAVIQAREDLVKNM